MKKGYLITFEGIDGCGKSTQLKLAERYLKKLGVEPLVIREPGSTIFSEKIRRILLDKKLSINAVTELNLYIAARSELVEHIIKPALQKGRIILCDRFYDSTTAYQAYGRRLDLNLVNKLNMLATDGIRPHLTFLFDIDYETSLLRRKKTADRLESESRTFFNRVRRGFLETARQDKRRFCIIDSRQSPDEISREVQTCLTNRLKI
jgi:dTMP kinase